MNTPPVRPRQTLGHTLSSVLPPCILLAWILLATGCGSGTETAEHVTLRLTTQELEPGSRFELTFENPVVRLADLGPVPANPLRIDPPLAGTFVWRSRRSGLFNPSEPMHLGTRYRFTLRPGLRDAAGQLVAARLQRSFDTPGLTVTLQNEGWWNESDAPAVPAVIASLNARVDAVTLARHASFRDGHQTIAALVEPIEDPPEDAEEAPALNHFPWSSRAGLTWEERFPGSTNTSARAPIPSGRAAGFVIRPAQPLESTNLWRLEITAGLASPETSARLGTVAVHAIGKAVPFAVVSVEAANHVFIGREIRLQFSRRVAAELATNKPASWFQCQPEVSGLNVSRSAGGQGLAISGAFELDRDYRITVKAGLPGEEPITLRQPFTDLVRFERMEPAVWLAEFSTIQLATGRRQLELLTVNTPETRLRIKALDRHGLIPTLRAYERYLRDGNPFLPDTLPGASLDYAGIPGRTVLDTNLVTAGNLDEPMHHLRSWNDLGESETHGAFFIEADLHQLSHAWNERDTRVGPQAVVQLTDLGLVTKTGARDTTVWVFSHTTAKALPGVTVSLRTDENEVLAEALTDAEGLVHFPASVRTQWVLAEQAGDLHAERSGSGEVSLWPFRLPGINRETTGVRLFAFSDREAYRPGETLHLKVLARRWQDEGWQIPTNPFVQLQLEGPRGDTTLRTNLVLGPSGSAEWTWTAPHGTRGTFQATLGCDDGQLNHPFEVRDFQPAAFEVTLGSKPTYDPGETVAIPLQARYLFGQPLAHAKVLWTAVASDQAFNPGGWETFCFGPALGDWRLSVAAPGSGNSTHHGTGQISAGAPLVLTPDLPFNPVHPQPQKVELLAEVTDLNQQTLSRSAEFVRHPSDFYLGFRWTRGEEALLTTNHPLAFQLVAVRPDGTPWPTPLQVSARLRRVEWKSVRILAAGRVIGHSSEPEYHDLLTQTVRTQTTAREGERWRTAADTASAAEFPALAEPGYYILELRTEDGARRPVLTSVGFGVSGNGRLAWNDRNGAQLDLVPDRAVYPPGGTATLLVKAPFPGTALVTVERQDVRRSFIAELEGNAPTVQIPLQTNDSPNVFVSVTLVRGLTGNPHAFPMPEWRLGYHVLNVPAPQDSLDVRITTDTPVRAPGEKVGVRVVVRDSTGGAVPGAEVTLYAVDEGFLLLKGTLVPDPSTSFAEPRPLGVATALSLPNLLPEDPQLRNFANKGHLAGGGGQLGHKRQNFVPCPYWNSSLLTDAHGEVAVSFVAPDGLTRYRLVAVATHGARAMGSGASAFEVRKNLMIEPALPRFAHVGDRLTARALVFNQGDRELSVQATLNPGTNTAFAPGTTGTARVTVAAGGTAVVEFPIIFQTPGSDLWQWRVEAEGLSDALATPLPVTHAGAGLRDVRHLRIPAGTTNLLAGADPAVLEQPETVSIRLATTPLALLGENVEQLLHYPYGCAEQTGSSMLPWLALRDYPGLLPAVRRDPTNFTAALNAGVQRFWSMQTPDGGLGYWPGASAPQRWSSAYAAWILALARDAGADVSTDRLSRLHQWLDQQWRKDAPDPSPDDLHERCLTAFAFAAAGIAEPALHQALLLQQDRLTSEDRALLALALARSQDDRKVAVALLRLPPGKRESTGRYGNGARITALRLLGFTALDPDGPETHRMLDELIGAGQPGHWVTTQGNAWALWALTEHARRSGAPQSLRGELRLGTSILSFEIDHEHAVASADLPLSPADASGGLRLNHASATPLYVEVTVAGRRPVGTNATPALDHGFTLRRQYARLDEQNKPHPTDVLRVGDRVLVTLEIDAPEIGEWMVIEDPLPAVLEPVQGVFKTEATGASALLDSWSSDFREVRSDRTLIFRNYLPDGRHVIRYLARVRAAGDVVAAPAKIEAMYEPQRHGYSAGARLSATPAE